MEEHSKERPGSSTQTVLKVARIINTKHVNWLEIYIREYTTENIGRGCSLRDRRINREGKGGRNTLSLFPPFFFPELRRLNI